MYKYMTYLYTHNKTIDNNILLYRPFIATLFSSCKSTFLAYSRKVQYIFSIQKCRTMSVFFFDGMWGSTSSYTYIIRMFASQHAENKTQKSVSWYNCTKYERRLPGATFIGTYLQSNMYCMSTFRSVYFDNSEQGYAHCLFIGGNNACTYWDEGDALLC